MKKMQSFIYTLSLIIILICCILQSELVLEGARNGINLCIQMVIPSLFPFIFLISMLSSYCSGGFYGLRAVARIIKVPPQANHILISAFLCGYPVGAQSVATAYKCGQITKKSAARLLAFCNNAGPSFILGFLGTMFSCKLAPLLLWIIHIISAMIIGIASPESISENIANPILKRENNTEIIRRSLQSMAIICGWIVLFRVLITLLNQHLLSKLPTLYVVLICGILELSNGCILLSNIGDESVRFILASLMLSLGGFCVLLQTKSVADDIPLRKYVIGKSIQSVISVILASLVSSLIF